MIFTLRVALIAVLLIMAMATFFTLVDITREGKHVFPIVWLMPIINIIAVMYIITI